MAPNSVVPLHPSVSTHFDFLPDPVPEEWGIHYPSSFLSERWGFDPLLAKTLTVLILRANNAAQRLKTLAEIPAHILPRLELLRKNSSATGLNYDAHTLSLPGITQLQFQKTSKSEQRFWERHATSWFKPAPRCTPHVDYKTPWPTTPFEFFSDANNPLPGPREPIQFRYTPLPGPWREPVKLRYFEHKPDCKNKISPNDLVDSYDQHRYVRACPHCHGLLRRGKSTPNTWCTPLHWDVATQEVFGARAIPKQPTYPPVFAGHYFEAPGKSPIRKFVKTGFVDRDPNYLERKDKGPYVVGDWDDSAEPELKYWIASQKVHPLDQNYFLAERMQGAMRNNFCTFTVRDGEANLTFKSPRESNNDEITETEIVTKDENGHRLANPLRVVKIEPENVFELREKEEDHAAAAFHALFNDSASSDPDFKPTRHHRHDPWKLLPFNFEKDGSVFRVLWLSVGKGYRVVSCEVGELDRKTIDDKFELLHNALELFRDTLAFKKRKDTDVAISIKKEYLWSVNEISLRRPTKEMQSEWEKILKAFKLQVLKLGTRETREVPTTRQTTKGRTIPRVEHDSASGVKIQTLRQREIRRMRKAEKKQAPLQDELLEKYVAKMSISDADPICRGGCFALVQLHHLELKRLGPYSMLVNDVWLAFAQECRKSIRNATKYERKAANRKGLSKEKLQERIGRRVQLINLAFDQAAVFRRPHCIEHG